MGLIRTTETKPNSNPDTNPNSYPNSCEGAGILRDAETCQGYFAENQVQNVPQITPYRFSAFFSWKIPHFRGSQNYHLPTLYNRCATDA